MDTAQSRVWAGLYRDPLVRIVSLSLVMAAIVVRLVAIAVLHDPGGPGSSYTYEHGQIAANLVEGRGFRIELLGGEGPTSQQAPLYPVLLAGCYALAGVETAEAILLVQGLQAIAGGLMVVVTIALTREVVPGRELSAWMAGALVAFHPTLVYATTHVQVAPWAALLLTTILWQAYRTSRSGSIQTDTGLGFLLGLAMLFDPILGLAGPAACWIAWRGWLRNADQDHGMSRACRFGRIIVIGLAALLTISPWLIRNARVHGEFVAIKSTFGYAFWQGNCALSEGTDKVVRASVEEVLAQARKRPKESWSDQNRTLWEARHEAGYLDDIALTPERKQWLGQQSEPERSRILLRWAIADLKQQPWRYPQLCLRRLRYFFLFDETNPKTRHPVYRAGHLGLSIAALLGLAMAGPAIRNRLAPTLLAVGAIAGFHALTIVSARFHIPVEPTMAVWAGMIGSRWSISRQVQEPGGS